MSDAYSTTTASEGATPTPIPTRKQGLKSALVLLSLYPIRFRERSHFSYRAGVGWFGWVGLLVALPAFFIAMFTQWVLSDQTIAFFCLCSSAIVTRMMHLDGLADVADAWWGGASPGRRREIMSDTATGSFALVAVTLTILGTFLALSNIITAKRFLILIVVPMLARIVVVYAITHLPPAKKTGLAAQIAGPLPASGVIATGTALVFALVLAVTSVGWLGLLVCSVTMIGGYLGARACAHRMGGVTGDVLGATIVATELLGYGLFMMIPVLPGGAWLLAMLH